MTEGRGIVSLFSYPLRDEGEEPPTLFARKTPGKGLSSCKKEKRLLVNLLTGP
jgi:hypothetical protein